MAQDFMRMPSGCNCAINPLRLCPVHNGEIYPNGAVVRMPSIQPAPAKTVFDEAREQIARWEKSDPRMEHIILIMDAADDVGYTVCGPAMKQSEIAGLCFAAAQAAVE